MNDKYVVFAPSDVAYPIQSVLVQNLNIPYGDVLTFENYADFCCKILSYGGDRENVIKATKYLLIADSIIGPAGCEIAAHWRKLGFGGETVGITESMEERWMDHKIHAYIVTKYCEGANVQGLTDSLSKIILNSDEQIREVGLNSIK